MEAIYLTSGFDYQETHFHYLTFEGENGCFRESDKVQFGLLADSAFIGMYKRLEVFQYENRTGAPYLNFYWFISTV